MRLSACLLLALAVPAFAQPTIYRIDAEHTRAEFVVDYLGVFHAHGRFEALAGRLAYDPAARAGSIMLDISAASVATGWDARDDFIRGRSMIDATSHPRVHFRSTRFEFVGDRLVHVAGDLMLRGVRHAITLEVRRIDCRADACAAEVLGTIRRRDFGMDAMWPVLGDEVQLEFRIHAVRD